MDKSLVRHDILNAIRTLGLAIDDLKSGYHFDDADAPEKIARLEEIHAVLAREIPPLL